MKGIEKAASWLTVAGALVVCAALLVALGTGVGQMAQHPGWLAAFCLGVAVFALGMLMMGRT